MERDGGKVFHLVRGRRKQNVGIYRSIFLYKVQYGIKQNLTYKSFAGYLGFSFSHFRPQSGDRLAVFLVVAVHVPNVFLHQVQDRRVGNQDNLKVIK